MERKSIVSGVTIMIIGLTGGISSGKSTVSRMLKDLGAVIIDADQIAREVVKPSSPTLQKIREQFGASILLPNGELDRQALGQVVFNDQEARLRLNAIIHPAIRAEMIRQKEEAMLQNQQLIVLDIPLLFESKLEHLVEKILVVYVPEEYQLARLMKRDRIDEQTAWSRIRSQIPIEEKKLKGQAYIDNSGSLEETKDQLKNILVDWGIYHEAE